MSPAFKQRVMEAAGVQPSDYVAAEALEVKHGD